MGINIDDPEVNSLGVVPNGSGGTNVIAGTYSGIFVSTNDGGSWQGVEPQAMPLDYVVTYTFPSNAPCTTELALMSD